MWPISLLELRYFFRKKFCRLIKYIVCFFWLLVWYLASRWWSLPHWL